MEDYTLTVGLEIHAELATKTKMFCNSANDTKEARPNTNVCPVCTGYPGTLPVINKEAVRSVLRLGVAVGGEISEYTEFDRKNYFYPDIPKGYQISQYKHPLVQGGSLANVAITRIHLEEDTAKSIHNEKGESLLDFNRAGTPLVELVTEPVIHDSETASRFAREFQLLLTYLDVSHANMERGEMRVEANISVSKTGEKGTKVEVKNLNSFKSVEKAIKYEFERQVKFIADGGKVIQETRGWDEEKEETFSQRAKEGSHDYRYFPDPDLPKLSIKDIPEFGKDALAASLSELPWQKRERFLGLGISKEHTEIYVTQPEWGRYFEEVVEILKEPELLVSASNYITSDLKDQGVAPLELVEVVRMISKNELSSRGAKEVLKILTETGGEAKKVAEQNNLIQRNNTEELNKIAREIINENTVAVEEFKKGKTASLQFLIGQAMKVTKGSANPQVLKEIFEKIL